MDCVLFLRHLPKVNRDGRRSTCDIWTRISGFYNFIPDYYVCLTIRINVELLMPVFGNENIGSHSSTLTESLLSLVFVVTFCQAWFIYICKLNNRSTKKVEK